MSAARRASLKQLGENVEFWRALGVLGVVWHVRKLPMIGIEVSIGRLERLWCDVGTILHGLVGWSYDVVPFSLSGILQKNNTRANKSDN